LSCAFIALFRDSAIFPRMVLSPSNGADNNRGELVKQTRQASDIVQRNKCLPFWPGIIDRSGAFPYVLGLA
jgi:hypothetical protein